MNLHEYQAKELLAKYGLPVQQGVLATNSEEAAAAFEQLAGKFAVIKAQVHAGGRGKAGGVKVVKSRDEAAEVAGNLIGKNLVPAVDAEGRHRDAGDLMSRGANSPVIAAQHCANFPRILCRATRCARRCSRPLAGSHWAARSWRRFSRWYRPRSREHWSRRNRARRPHH